MFRYSVDGCNALESLMNWEDSNYLMMNVGRHMEGALDGYA